MKTYNRFCSILSSVNLHICLILVVSVLFTPYYTIHPLCTIPYPTYLNGEWSGPSLIIYHVSFIQKTHLIFGLYMDFIWLFISSSITFFNIFCLAFWYIARCEFPCSEFFRFINKVSVITYDLQLTFIGIFCFCYNIWSMYHNIQKV